MIYIVATDFNPSKIGAYFREFPSDDSYCWLFITAKPD